jgi:hypothetical protein
VDEPFAGPISLNHANIPVVKNNRRLKRKLFIECDGLYGGMEEYFNR